MKIANMFSAVVVAASMMVIPLEARAVIDSNAPVVQLRTSCTEAGATLNNCFTGFSSLLPWIWGTRNPSSSAPLIVEIAPGTFPIISNLCQSAAGHVTFRGAGRGRTLLTSSNEAVITVADCGKLGFESLSVIGSVWAITWSGGGESVWTNVEVEAPLLPWYDSLNSLPCAAGQGGKHYWFSSTIRVSRTTNTYPGVGVPAYYSICGDSWFWGSEIANLNINNTSGMAGVRRGILAVGAGASVHVYGGNIRLVSDVTTSVSQMIGAQVAQGANIHIHGTGIDVEASGAAAVVALKVGAVLGSGPGGEIHANETSYSLKTASGGTVNRVNKDSSGHVHAPYLWETHPDVPFADQPGVTFSSYTGYDMAVVTNTTDGHPHMVIYDASCATSKWFDTTTNACR